MNKIFERRSVREFLDKDIPLEDVKDMLYASMQAPSAKRQLPWSFVVLDKTHISKLMQASSGAKALKEANKVVVFIMNTGLICPEFVEQDMASALTCFMLEARNKNVGSIWIGTYPHEDRVKFINDYLGIKEPNKAFAMVGIGYPKDEAFKLLDERFDDTRIHIGKW